jgi:hypothetical protein
VTALRALGRVGLGLGRFVLAALASVFVAVAVIVCLASLIVLSALCLLASAAWPYGDAWRVVRPDAQRPSEDALAGVAAPAAANLRDAADILRGIGASIREARPPKAQAPPEEQRCPHGGWYATCAPCGVQEEIATDDRLRRQRAGMKLVN